MKLFVVLGVLAGGYVFMLLKMTDAALGSVQNIYQVNTSVSAAADAWANGDTSVSLTGAANPSRAVHP